MPDISTLFMRDRIINTATEEKLNDCMLLGNGVFQASELASKRTCMQVELYEQDAQLSETTIRL